MADAVVAVEHRHRQQDRAELPGAEEDRRGLRRRRQHDRDPLPRIDPMLAEDVRRLVGEILQLAPGQLPPRAVEALPDHRRLVARMLVADVLGDVVALGHLPLMLRHQVFVATHGGEPSLPRALALLILSCSCAMTSGSRSVVTSPSSRPSAMSFSNRRMILPERVLGRSSAQMMRLGRASLPMRIATCSRISPTSASVPSRSPSSVTNATTDWPVSSSVGADHGGLGDLAVRDDRRLDLGGRHPVPAHVEHVVDAADDRDVVLVVLLGGVADQVGRAVPTSPNRSR